MRHFLKRINWYYKDKVFTGWLHRIVSDIAGFDVYIQIEIETGRITLSIENKIFPNLNMEEKEVESVESAEQEIDRFFDQMAETRKAVIKQVGKQIADDKKRLVWVALRELNKEEEKE